MKYTIGTLFSGIGGPEVAARALGMKELFYCDINEFGLAVLRKHFPDAEEFHDVTKEDFSKYMGMVTMMVGGFPCFAEGTPVLTSEGYLPIEEVRKGMMVYTHNGKFEKVLQTMSHIGHALMEIGVEGLDVPIRCTPNHSFLVFNRRKDFAPEWVQANELTSDMFLFAPDSEQRRRIDGAHSPTSVLRPSGEKNTFKIVTIIRKFKTQTFYNLNVEHEHTYTVHGIAVHNCQPFSSAGERRGADDHRYLWPYFLKVINQVRPTVVIGENVAGIATMVEPNGEPVQVERQASLFDEGDEVREFELRERYTISRVCEDLDGAGYNVQPVLVPAAAVGAPHKRNRVFFIAFRKDGVVCGVDRFHVGIDPGADGGDSEETFQWPASDSLSDGLQGAWHYGGHDVEERMGQDEGVTQLPGGAGDARSCPGWRSFPAESPLCGRDDGFCTGLVRYLTPNVYAHVAELMDEGVRVEVDAMLRGRPDYKDMVRRHKIRFGEIPVALMYGVKRDMELSAWAPKVSDKIMGYMDGKLKTIDSTDKFFALCRKVQDELRSIRRYVYQESLKAYGNAIVPAVIYEIMKACLDSVDRMRGV